VVRTYAAAAAFLTRTGTYNTRSRRQITPFCALIQPTSVDISHMAGLSARGVRALIAVLAAATPTFCGRIRKDWLTTAGLMATRHRRAR
jgi:hypothetical protein